MTESVFTSAYEAVIAAVVDIRNRAGLTQRQLAETLEREQSFIGRIETGQRRLDLVEFVWICQACGADPDVEVAAVTSRIAKSVKKGKRRTRN